MRIVQFVGICGLLVGCSTYVTTQSRVEFDPKSGVKIAELTTTVKSRALFDSKSELSKSTVSQSDKTQSSKVGSLVNEASGTNAVAVLNALQGIVNSLPK